MLRLAGVDQQSGFFVVHLKHLNMTEVAAWIPLLLLLVDLHAAERRVRYVVLFALVVTWANPLSLLGLDGSFWLGAALAVAGLEA